MQLSFNSYDNTPAVKIPIADKAIKRKENFNWTIKISDTYSIVLGQTGTSPIGSFIVKNISYVSAGTLELTLTTFPSSSSISKVKVLGQSKDMPGSAYTANFALPDIKSYSRYQTLYGIPDDWFTDHLMVHSSLSPAYLTKVVQARQDYVSKISDLLKKVSGGQDGVFNSLLAVSDSGNNLIQVGESAGDNDSQPGITGIEGLSTAGPMTGFTMTADDWASKGGNSIKNLGTYARDLSSVYTTPMAFPSWNPVGMVGGNNYVISNTLTVTLSDFEIMSGTATIQIGTYNITLDLTKLPLDAQNSNRNNQNKLYIKMFARNDYRVDGSTTLVVSYGFYADDDDGGFDINKPIDTSISIPNQKINIGESPFVSAALSSLQVPFNGMSTIEMSVSVVKSYLEDAYSYGADKGQIDITSITTIMASIVAIIGVFSISPVAGAGLGAILLAMAIESNIPVLRRGELDKLAGGVLAQYGIAKSQVNLEGDVPRQANGANRSNDLAGVNLYYTSNVAANTSIPKIITTDYIAGDYAKWATRPRELRQPITRNNVSDYPTPFSYWGVEAITTTPDPQVKQALSYLNTGDI